MRIRNTRRLPANTNNEVLFNIWNWSLDWTLDVVDEKQQQTGLFGSLGLRSAPYSGALRAEVQQREPQIDAVVHHRKFTHFFKVKAPDADTDLTITVKDEFGNTWTENMQRPKAFSTDAYKRK